MQLIGKSVPLRECSWRAGTRRGSVSDKASLRIGINGGRRRVICLGVRLSVLLSRWRAAFRPATAQGGRGPAGALKFRKFFSDLGGHVVASCFGVAACALGRC